MSQDYQFGEQQDGSVLSEEEFQEYLGGSGCELVTLAVKSLMDGFHDRLLFSEGQQRTNEMALLLLSIPLHITAN